jgi:tetratricopeptide (TPR) repeat protein
MSSDPLRTETPRTRDATSDADRDARIEQLLLSGLDHYFAAHYELAINVWTRALFFDRSHARARAYIERARSALAERQRQAEELIQGGAAAFRRGDAGEARRLLQAAIDSGAPLEDAFPILERLNRMDPVSPAPPHPRLQSDRPEPVPTQSAAGASRPSRGLAWPLITLIALMAIGAYAAVASTGDWRMLVGLQGVRSATLAPSARDVLLALPQRGEMALTRARNLAAGGALHDALTALDAVRATDPQKPDADRLRADLQRELLRLGAEHQP